MSNRQPRFRNFCFTLNNYTNEHRERLSELYNSGVLRYLVYQPEIAPTTGTQHLQGYCQFLNPRTESGARGALIGCHVSVARGNSDENYAYCTKDDGRDESAGFGPTEFGDRDRGAGRGSGHRTDLVEVAERIRDGATIAQVAADHPGTYIRYTRGVLSFAQLHVRRRSHKTIVHWFWGPTGSGKTRAASEASPDAYWKSSSHQWWDGYDGRADVIIDDYRPSFCQFNELLRLLDRYPYQAQVKGGTVECSMEHIYITSPKSPEDVWAGRTEEDLAQLSRRIEEVRFFPACNHN